MKPHLRKTSIPTIINLFFQRIPIAASEQSILKKIKPGSSRIPVHQRLFHSKTLTNTSEVFDTVTDQTTSHSNLHFNLNTQNGKERYFAHLLLNFQKMLTSIPTAKSRTMTVRLISMAMTGFYRTMIRPRTHRPLSMLKYDPVVRKKVLFLEATKGGKAK